mgnify:CR=1 FL=1
MKKLCAVRDILRSLTDYENRFHKEHSLCLNEGMVLCCLKDKRLSSGEIAEEVNLTCSNTSKLLRSVEERGFIVRVLGERDKRQMYFELTPSGVTKLMEIESDDIELSDPLGPIVKQLI